MKCVSSSLITSLSLRQSSRRLRPISKAGLRLLQHHTLSRPSAVLSLWWPEPGDAAEQLQLTGADATPLSAKIGVSVEDVAALPSLNMATKRRIERLAMKFGENVFNFMQSFCGVDGRKLVIPIDILDRWFKKLEEKAKRDLDFPKSFAL